MPKPFGAHPGPKPRRRPRKPSKPSSVIPSFLKDLLVEYPLQVERNGKWVTVQVRDFSRLYDTILLHNSLYISLEIYKLYLLPQYSFVNVHISDHMLPLSLSLVCYEKRQWRYRGGTISGPNNRCSFHYQADGPKLQTF
jgi:hypothetical protein